MRILLDEIATLVPPRCPVMDHASHLFFVVIVPQGQEAQQYADACPGCGVVIEGVQYVVKQPSPEFIQQRADAALYEKLRACVKQQIRYPLT